MKPSLWGIGRPGVSSHCHTSVESLVHNKLLVHSNYKEGHNEIIGLNVYYFRKDFEFDAPTARIPSLTHQQPNRPSRKEFELEALTVKPTAPKTSTNGIQSLVLGKYFNSYVNQLIICKISVWKLSCTVSNPISRPRSCIRNVRGALFVVQVVPPDEDVKLDTSVKVAKLGRTPQKNIANNRKHCLTL